VIANQQQNKGDLIRKKPIRKTRGSLIKGKKGEKKLAKSLF
jgi:hypothetical protein